MRRTNRKIRNTFTRRSNSKAITLMLLSRGFIKFPTLVSVSNSPPNINPINLLAYGINRVDA